MYNKPFLTGRTDVFTENTYGINESLFGFLPKNKDPNNICSVIMSSINKNNIFSSYFRRFKTFNITTSNYGYNHN